MSEGLKWCPEEMERKANQFMPFREKKVIIGCP
jgi:hypothetical protein